MGLKDDIPLMIKHIEANKPFLDHNKTLFDIYEGDLLTHVLADLEIQLGQQSFKQAKHRVAPINLLKRLIDKLSKIYNKPPERLPLIENQSDSDLISFWEETTQLDTHMDMANELFNLHKGVAVEPFLDRGEPALRVIPYDRFLPMSTDSVNPLRPTHMLKIMGEITRDVTELDTLGDVKTTTTGTTLLIFAYTDTEFLAFNTFGKVEEEIMGREGVDGKNPWGRIPIIYFNRSRHTLIPTIDSDTLAMTKLFPIMLSDANFALMFQAFSIVYGIDVDDENLTMAPNAFWRLKSDPTAKGRPQIGQIKPEVDTDKVITMLTTQLSMWLQSRNVRPGSMGSLKSENFVNGISKMVDEMDTFEDRQKQVPFFKFGEQNLWDVIKIQHNSWVQSKAFNKMNVSFTDGAKCVINFPKQQPELRITDVQLEIKKDRELGLTTRLMDLKRRHPNMSSKEIDELKKRIDEERTLVVDIKDPEEEKPFPPKRKGGKPQKPS